MSDIFYDTKQAGHGQLVDATNNFVYSFSGIGQFKQTQELHSSKYFTQTNAYNTQQQQQHKHSQNTYCSSI